MIESGAKFALYHLFENPRARGEFRRELVVKAAEAGLYSAVFPESVGGSNMGCLATAVIQEEMVRNDVRF